MDGVRNHGQRGKFRGFVDNLCVNHMWKPDFQWVYTRLHRFCSSFLSCPTFSVSSSLSILSILIGGGWRQFVSARSECTAKGFLPGFLPSPCCSRGDGVGFAVYTHRRCVFLSTAITSRFARTRTTTHGLNTCTEGVPACHIHPHTRVNIPWEQSHCPQQEEWLEECARVQHRGRKVPPRRLLERQSRLWALRSNFVACT
jgi:hypothetical protein